ncbi:MAG: hypothetical protein MJ209_03650 [archaeon]|nr:hypothetical protein [archaeon]
MDESKTYIKILSGTPIGDIVIIWSKNEKFLIEEIILSNPDKTSIEIANEKYPNLIKAKKTPKKLKNH